MDKGWVRVLIFIVGIMIGSSVASNIHWGLGGLIQLAVIIFVTKEFWGFD